MVRVHKHRGHRPRLLRPTVRQSRPDGAAAPATSTPRVDTSYDICRLARRQMSYEVAGARVGRWFCRMRWHLSYGMALPRSARQGDALQKRVRRSSARQGDALQKRVRHTNARRRDARRKWARQKRVRHISARRGDARRKLARRRAAVPGRAIPRSTAPVRASRRGPWGARPTRSCSGWSGTRASCSTLAPR